MKKLIALLAALTLLVAFAPACGKKTAATDQEGGKSTKKSRAEKKKEAKEAREAKAREARESKSEKSKEENEGDKQPSINVTPAAPGSIVHVLIDRNTKGLTEKETTNREHIGSWMDADMVAALENQGVSAQMITERSEYKSGYLLYVRITEYKPANQGVRWAGGISTTSIDTHYELYAPGSKTPILSRDTHERSSGDWRHVMQVIDRKTADAVANKLGK